MSRNFDLRTEPYYSSTDSKIAIKNGFFFSCPLGRLSVIVGRTGWVDRASWADMVGGVCEVCVDAS